MKKIHGHVKRMAWLGALGFLITACTKEYTCACQDNDGFVSAKKQHQRNKEDAAAYCDKQDDEETLHFYEPSQSIDTTIIATRDCWLLE